MGAFKDLVGEKFGRLTVVERAENKSGKVRWLCVCDCGTERVVRAGSLKRGLTKSCGCLQKEIVAACNTKHGLRKNPWYKKARDIKNRITNPKSAAYENYGGRGLLLYEKWHDVGVFAAWLIQTFGEFPSSTGLSIDRINNSRGYFPDNLRLATKTEQVINRRKFKNSSSKFRGVNWYTASKKWKARVTYKKQQYHIGYYETQELAAKAWDAYVTQRGWPHILNFPAPENQGK